ncbi:MAG: hypothetical protein AAES65_01850 [Candidatus Thiodiazotropha sp. (ex. Lucinoma kazani)]
MRDRNHTLRGTKIPNHVNYVVTFTEHYIAAQKMMQLLTARTKSVTKTLIAKFPDTAKRLSAHGMGPLSPVATNEQENGRQLNRRVELVIPIA